MGLALLIGVHFIPAYKSPAYQERTERVRVLKKESRRIRKVAEELEQKAEESGSGDLKELSREARNMAKRLEDPRLTRQEAVAAVSKLTEGVRREKRKSKAFQDMVREMEKSELTRGIARDLTKGDVARATTWVGLPDWSFDEYLMPLIFCATEHIHLSLARNSCRCLIPKRQCCIG